MCAITDTQEMRFMAYLEKPLYDRLTPFSTQKHGLRQIFQTLVSEFQMGLQWEERLPKETRPSPPRRRRPSPGHPARTDASLAVSPPLRGRNLPPVLVPAKLPLQSLPSPPL